MATVDRYPPNPIDGDAKFADRLREIERRLGELEGANPIGHTAVRRGRLAVTDDDFDERVVLGQFDAAPGVPSDPPRYGLALLAENGTTIRWFAGDASFGPRFGVYGQTTGQGPLIQAGDTDLLDDPQLFGGWIRIEAGDQVVVTSASFVTAWQCGVSGIYHDMVALKLAVFTDGATTMDIRVREATSGVATATKTIAVSTNTEIDLRWQHGIDGVFPGTRRLWQLQALRASGAGSCSLRPSDNLRFVSSQYYTPAVGGWV